MLTFTFKNIEKKLIIINYHCLLLLTVKKVNNIVIISKLVVIRNERQLNLTCLNMTLYITCLNLKLPIRPGRLSTESRRISCAHCGAQPR